MGRLGEELSHLVECLACVLAVVETVGLADEEDLAEGFLEQLFGLGGGLADVFA